MPVQGRLPRRHRKSYLLDLFLCIIFSIICVSAGPMMEEVTKLTEGETGDLIGMEKIEESKTAENPTERLVKFDPASNLAGHAEDEKSSRSSRKKASQSDFKIGNSALISNIASSSGTVKDDTEGMKASKSNEQNSGTMAQQLQSGSRLVQQHRPTHSTPQVANKGVDQLRTSRPTFQNQNLGQSAPNLWIPPPPPPPPPTVLGIPVHNPGPQPYHQPALNLIPITNPHLLPPPHAYIPVYFDHPQPNPLHGQYHPYAQHDSLYPAPPTFLDTIPQHNGGWMRDQLDNGLYPSNHQMDGWSHQIDTPSWKASRAHVSGKQKTMGRKSDRERKPGGPSVSRNVNRGKDQGLFESKQKEWRLLIRPTSEETSEAKKAEETATPSESDSGNPTNSPKSSDSANTVEVVNPQDKVAGDDLNVKITDEKDEQEGRIEPSIGDFAIQRKDPGEHSVNTVAVVNPQDKVDGAHPEVKITDVKDEKDDKSEPPIKDLGMQRKDSGERPPSERAQPNRDRLLGKWKKPLVTSQIRPIANLQDSRQITDVPLIKKVEDLPQPLLLANKPSAPDRSVEQMKLDTSVTPGNHQDVPETNADQRQASESRPEASTRPDAGKSISTDFAKNKDVQTVIEDSSDGTSPRGSDNLDISSSLIMNSDKVTGTDEESEAGAAAKALVKASTTEKKAKKKKTAKKQNALAGSSGVKTGTHDELLDLEEMFRGGSTSANRHSDRGSPSLQTRTAMDLVVFRLLRPQDSSPNMDITLTKRFVRNLIKTRSFRVSNLIEEWDNSMKNFEELFRGAEGHRRVRSLSIQFDKQLTKIRWDDYEKKWNEDTKTVLLLLGVDELFPVFYDVMPEDWINLEQQIRKVTERNQQSFESAFSDADLSLRLATFYIMTKINNSGLPKLFKAEELQQLTKAGISVPLLLQAEYTLQLGSEEVKWAEEELRARSAEILNLMNGKVDTSGEEILVTSPDVSWLDSPERLYFLTEPRVSRLYMQHLKHLVARTDRFVVTPGQWEALDMTASQETAHEISVGEGIAAAHVGIKDLDVLAKFKKTIAKRRRSKGIIHWPKHVPEAVAAQSQKLKNFFELFEAKTSGFP